MLRWEHKDEPDQTDISNCTAFYLDALFYTETVPLCISAPSGNMVSYLQVSQAYPADEIVLASVGYPFSYRLNVQLL